MPDRDPHAVIIDAAYEWYKTRKAYQAKPCGPTAERYYNANEALTKAVLWNGEPQ